MKLDHRHAVSAAVHAWHASKHSLQDTKNEIRAGIKASERAKEPPRDGAESDISALTALEQEIDAVCEDLVKATHRQEGMQDVERRTAGCSLSSTRSSQEKQAASSSRPRASSSMVRNNRAACRGQGGDDQESSEGRRRDGGQARRRPRRHPSRRRPERCRRRSAGSGAAHRDDADEAVGKHAAARACPDEMSGLWTGRSWRRTAARVAPLPAPPSRT